jgi:hypothetical protein
VARISELKAALPAPEPAALCEGTALSTDAPSDEESALNGTYRYTITRQALIDEGSRPTGRTRTPAW